MCLIILVGRVLRPVVSGNSFLQVHLGQTELLAVVIVVGSPVVCFLGCHVGDFSQTVETFKIAGVVGIAHIDNLAPGLS